MSAIGLLFVGAGLLFAVRPAAAARYPGRTTATGTHVVRYVGAPILIALGLLIFLDITLP